MKRYVVALLIIVANVCSSHAQLFEYRDIGGNMAWVRPSFETLSVKEKKFGFMSFDNDYFINTINETAKTALPPKILAMLEKNHVRFRVSFYIANTGKVFYIVTFKK